MCVAAVGHRETEIGQGWACLTPRCRYRAHGLGIAWPLKLRSGGRKGRMHFSSDMLVGEVGGRDAEIGQGLLFLTLIGQISGEHTRYCLAIEKAPPADFPTNSLNNRTSRA